MPGNYVVLVRDKNLVYKEIIDDFIRMDLVLRYNDLGTWQLELDYDSPGAQALLSVWKDTTPKGLPGINVQRNGTEAFFSGPIRNLEEHWSADGHRLIISGYDDLAFLYERMFIMTPFAYQTSYASAYHQLSGNAEIIIKDIVTKTLGSSASAERQLSFLDVTLNQNRGYGSCLSRGRFQNALRECQRLAAFSEQKGVPIGFYMKQFGQRFQFDCYLPVDKSSTVIFSPDIGNVTEYRYIQQAPTGNLVMAGDGNSGATRGFAYGGDTPSRNQYGTIEMFVDAGNYDPTKISDEVDKALAENAEKTGFEFTYKELDSFKFQTDWNLGDKVRFQRGIESFADLVREVKITVDESGEVIQPVIGTAGLGRTFRLFDRVRNLEYHANDQDRY